MWDRFEPRSGREYPPQNSLRLNESAGEVEEHEAHLSVQEKEGAYAAVSSLSSDQIRRGESGSSSHFLSAAIPRAARSQRSVSRGKSSAEHDAPLQAELPSSFAVEKKLPELLIGDSKFDLEGIFSMEHTLFNVFYTQQNQLIPLGTLKKDFRLDDDQLPPKIYHLNKGLLKKGHLPIIFVRNCSSGDKLGGAYVWEGPDAPIKRKKFDVVLRQHSLAGWDRDRNFVVLGLRQEEYVVLSDLFAKIGLGVSRAEIVDILTKANINENVPSRMIFNLNRRIAQLGLAITSTGGKNTSYRLGRIEEASSS